MKRVLASYFLAVREPAVEAQSLLASLPFVVCGSWVHVAAEGLQARVAFPQPHLRHLAVVDGVEGCFELRRHQDQPLHGLLDVLERPANGTDEPIVPSQLLLEHGVKGPSPATHVY